MEIANIRRLCRYDAWANARFLRVIEGLTDEQRARPLTSSFPTVLGTLAHIVGSDWIWLERWEGRSPTAQPDWARAPSLPLLRERIVDLEARLDRFVASLDAGRVAAPFAWRRLNGQAMSAPLGDLLVHLVNHATYHRGQLTTMIRQVGGTPPGTDFSTFAAEQT